MASGSAVQTKVLGAALWSSDEELDGVLEIDDRPEHAALELAARGPGEEVSTAFSQEHEVGVKWKTNRGCRLDGPGERA
jgi:hypothetical protein